MSRPTGSWEDDAGRDDLARAVRSVPKPDPALSTVDKLRQIVRERQANRINGVYVDMTSASITLQVHDALSEANQAKLAAMPVRRMVAVALEVASRS